MSNLDGLDKRMVKALVVLNTHMHPPVKETRLPYLVVDLESGDDLPGWETHNEEHRQLAKRLRCIPKEYLSDPSIMGSL